MAAPKGNNYWQFAEKHGRNHKYTPEALWKEALAYFKWMDKSVWNKKEAIRSGINAGKLINIPTRTPLSIKSFCAFADIAHFTFLNYEKNDEFVEVITRIRQVIESNQFEGASVGAYNPNIIARILGLVDKTETDVTTAGKAIVNTPIDLSKLSESALKELEKASVPDPE